MAKGNAKKTIKRIIGIVIIPLICFVAIEIACLANGITLFSGGYTTFQLFMRGVTFVFLLSLGVAINLHTGRFDFSTGAVMLIGGVLGAQLSTAWGLGPVGMMFVSLIVGGFFGFLTGFFYTLLRLPPMIIGLGMALVLEGLVAIFTDGCKPVGFGSDSSYYGFAINPLALGIMIVIALAFMIIVFHYTKFGYDYRALQSGQRIAVNTGQFRAIVINVLYFSSTIKTFFANY